MNEAPNDHAVLERHEGPIRNPKHLILAVLAAFIIPIFIIVLLANFVTSARKPSAGNEESLEKEAVAKRIAPIAKLEWKDAGAVRVLKAGEEVYKAQCATCHAAGLAGSPKFGDAAAWAPRIATGYDKLLLSALKGKGAMAAQGGGDYSDVEVGRALVYMTNAAGGKLAEPAVPAVPAPAAAASTTAAGAATSATIATTAATSTAPAAATIAPAAVAVVAAAAPAQANGGEAIYKQVCVACHAAGVAGAPKSGDKAAWAPRIATGLDMLTQSVVKGKGAMPPKGGSAASDAEIRSAVEYMVSLNK
jgi:cytochrome c5